MTGDEIKIMAEALVDDDIEETLFYQLLNSARVNIEELRDWQILLDNDETQSSSPDDTYLTPKDLPSDFRSMTDEGYINVGVDSIHTPIPMSKKHIYRNSSQKYYLDIANDKFYIIGQPASTETIYLPYVKFLSDIASATSWGFPARFHKILSFIVAGYYTGGVDADDIFRHMSPEHKAAAQAVIAAMIKWDDKLAAQAAGFSATPDLIDSGARDNAINIYED